ncbi:MAG: hypothetical protein WAV85_19530 [Rhodoferax sp.]
MGDQQISSRLREIASGPKKTETARLRDIFDDVEHALMRKTQSEVLSILHEGGFKFTEAGFRYSLGKIRRERGLLKSKKNIPPSAAPTPTPAVTTVATGTTPATPAAAAPNTKENDKNQDPLKITGQSFFDGISDTPTKTPEIKY